MEVIAHECVDVGLLCLVRVYAQQRLLYGVIFQTPCISSLCYFNQGHSIDNREGMEGFVCIFKKI